LEAQVPKMDITSQLLPHKKIVILGVPKSGKTTLAKQLQDSKKFDEHAFVWADKYAECGYEEQLYAMIGDMQGHMFDKFVLEGVLAFRYLRKVEEQQDDLRYLIPDVIVLCRPPEVIEDRHMAMTKGLMKIWAGIEMRKTVPVIDYAF